MAKVNLTKALSAVREEMVQVADLHPYAGIVDGRGPLTRYHSSTCQAPAWWIEEFVAAGGGLDSNGVWGLSPGPARVHYDDPEYRVWEVLDATTVANLGLSHPGTPRWDYVINNLAELARFGFRVDPGIDYKHLQILLRGSRRHRILVAGHGRLKPVMSLGHMSKNRFKEHLLRTAEKFHLIRKSGLTALMWEEAGFGLWDTDPQEVLAVPGISDSSRKYWEQKAASNARKQIQEQIAAASKGAMWPQHSEKAIQYFVRNWDKLPVRKVPGTPWERVSTPRPTCWFPLPGVVIENSYVETRFYNHGMPWRQGILIPVTESRAYLIDHSLGSLITPLHRDWVTPEPTITEVKLLPREEGGFTFLIEKWTARDGSPMEYWGAVRKLGESSWPYGDRAQGINTWSEQVG